MWPFRRQIQIPRFSANVRKALAENPGSGRNFERGEIPFVLLQVCDQQVEEIGPRIEQVVTKAVDAGGIADIMSSVILITFGFPRNAWPAGPPSIADAERLAKALVLEMNTEVKALYGCATGLFGNLGSSHYFQYGPAIPGFGAIVANLTKLEFGTAGKI